jgi:hypothetical protein
MKIPSIIVFAGLFGSSIATIGDHCTYPVEGAVSLKVLFSNFE